MENGKWKMENGRAQTPRLHIFHFPFSIFHVRSMSITVLQQYLAVGGIMFAIGLLGFMCRRNLIVMFLCTELMFQGVAINLIAFGRYHGNFAGQAFVIFVLVIAAAEASLALGLVVLLFKQKNTLDADAWRELKG
jgi:NADH-quinone oxidoreductase subunit K